MKVELVVNIIEFTCKIFHSIFTFSDRKNQCWLAVLVIAVAFFVIGIPFWITVGVMVSNPPDGSKYKSQSS